jgi:hypothetical protein
MRLRTQISKSWVTIQKLPSLITVTARSSVRLDVQKPISAEQKSLGCGAA